MADGRVIEEAAEVVADQIEEVAEVTRRLTGREVGFFFGGVAAGFAIGYFVQEKRLRTKYENLFDEEIAEMKEHYRKKIQVAEFNAGKPSAEQIIEERGYRSETVVEEVVEEPEAETTTTSGDPVEDVRRNIFRERMESDQSWDYTVEARQRAQNPGVPYVIHAEEHRENALDYEQVTFTFYEEDGVLCDSRDQIIDDPEGVVGLPNLQRLGVGSLDPNVVYVRNERLNLDIEICLNPRSYAEDVHGLRHSDERRRPPTRRHFDDE